MGSAVVAFLFCAAGAAAEEQRPEQRRSWQKRSEEKRSEEKRPDGKRTDGKRPDELRPEGSREFGDSAYRLGPEDVIDVFVWKEPELSTTAVVRPDGFISLPLANEMRAGGKSVEELQGEIKEKLSEFVTDPVVSVILKEIKSPRVTVLGEVREPNVYRIGQKASVFDAIAMAGGFTEFAVKNEVTVIRQGNTGVRRIRLDLRDLVNGQEDLFYLRPSDTVYVR
jgi:polysaccharide export outer membrane protein